MIRANHPSTVLLELLQHQKNKHPSSFPRCNTKFVPKDVSYDAEMMEKHMRFNPNTNTANIDQYHLVDNNGMKTITENHRATPLASRATPLASRSTPLVKRVSFVNPLTSIVRMPTPYTKTGKRIRKTPKSISHRMLTRKRIRNNSREKEKGV